MVQEKKMLLKTIEKKWTGALGRAYIQDWLTSGDGIERTDGRKEGGRKTRN